MRFGTAVMAAAAVGLVEVHAKHSNYAIKKVRDTRHRLESIHGKGLVGLYDERGEFAPHRLGKGLKSKRLTGGASARVDELGASFPLDGWVMRLIGALQGFTYSEVQGEDNAFTNCLYGGFAIIENIDNITYIFEHAADDAGSYKWFEFVIEEPINLVMNSTVLYQMCNFSEYITMIKGWLDIDISAFAYDGTSMIVNGVMDIPVVISEWNQIQCTGTCSCDGQVVAPEDCDETVDGYAMGKLIGKAVVEFFGTTVSPVVA